MSTPRDGLRPAGHAAGPGRVALALVGLVVAVAVVLNALPVTL